MFEFIERLRQKSDKTKKRIAFLSAFCFVGLILVMWLTIVYPDFSFVQKQKQTASVGDTGMFDSFFANITEGFGGIKNQIQSMKDMFYSVSTSTHYTLTDESTTTISTEENTSGIEQNSQGL